MNKNYIKLLITSLAVFLLIQNGVAQEDGIATTDVCISGDCENGFGTYILSNGDKYVGTWK